MDNRSSVSLNPMIAVWMMTRAVRLLSAIKRTKRRELQQKRGKQSLSMSEGIGFRERFF